MFSHRLMAADMKKLTGVFAAAIVVTSFAHAATPPVRPAASGRRLQLRAVRVRPMGDSIQVAFVLDGPARYKLTRTVQPARITIDLLQTTISPLLTHREFLSEHAALVRILLVRSAGVTRGCRIQNASAADGCSSA